MTPPEQASAGPAPAATAPAPRAILGFHQFSAMNAEVRIFTASVDSPQTMVAAEESFHNLERRFSRFLPDTELSYLNERRSARVRVSAEMLAVLRLCVRMHRATGGLFDPAILPSLERAGYDRSFEQVPAEGAASRAPMPARQSITQVSIDASRSAVRLPDGMRLDFGGIGKGFAVDRAATIMAPLSDFLVDAGGDIVARGDGPSGEGWLVAVGHPLSPETELMRVVLQDEAIATSGIVRRRWRRGGSELHHIIDPRSGEPSETDCHSVSVIAPTAVEADVFAKSAIIAGSAGGAALLEARRLPGFFLLSDGSIRTTHDWEERTDAQS
jgi:thiamine biosynthesis lipoprotein